MPSYALFESLYPVLCSDSFPVGVRVHLLSFVCLERMFLADLNRIMANRVSKWLVVNGIGGN